jgi:hypothetical protein
MRIEFHTDSQPISAAVQAHAEETLRRAFERFSNRVRQVRIYFWDVNGPRGGIDKGVRLVVELIPTGEVLVRHIHESEFAAVSEVVARARYAVSQRLDRNRDRRRRSAQRAGLALAAT